MNQVFYPTQGTNFKVSLRRSLNNYANVNPSDEMAEDLNSSTNGFTKMNLNFEKRFPFHKKYTAIIGADAGFIFYDNLESNEISFTTYGFGAKYYLGGNLLRPRKDDYIFRGLNESELPVTQFMNLALSLQFNVNGKLYLTPHINIASVGFNDFDDYLENAFSPNGSWQETLETSSVISAGITTSLNTILGPLDFDVSWVNDINKIRFFIGVGYQFNRSN
jgi:NTE family protein